MDVGSPPVEAIRVSAPRTDLLFDANATPEITGDHFEPAWWHAQRAERGRALGRGTVMFVRAPWDDGSEWVVRHYLRGGWIARLSRDRYVWTGLERTRPWREWRLTRRLRALDLPVPLPIAARVQRHGLVYTGDLITEKIPDTETLAERLRGDAISAAQWHNLGALLRRFHDAGLRHDDINAANVLWRERDATFHVIDFDRAALVPPGPWQERNLARFRRSLDKHRRLAPHFAFTASDWTTLLRGYRQARADKVT